VLTHRNFQAQKQLQSAGGGFSFFGGREEKYQEAADLFTQAANAFKMQQQSTRLPLCFVMKPKLTLPDV
jgi:hypothetical protein